MMSRALKMGGFLGATSYFLEQGRKRRVRCCGIMGYIGDDESAWEVLA